MKVIKDWMPLFGEDASFDTIKHVLAQFNLKAGETVCTDAKFQVLGTSYCNERFGDGSLIATSQVIKISATDTSTIIITTQNGSQYDLITQSAYIARYLNGALTFYLHG